MRLYGLHDPSIGRIVEWYTSLDSLEQELEALGHGEPEWASQLEVLAVVLPDGKTALKPKIKRPKG